MLQTTQLGTLTALKTLKKLDNLNIDLTPITTKLNTIETKVNAIPITDLSGVNNQLIAISSKLDLIQASQSGLVFTQLTLNPTYQLNASNGWTVIPTNLQNIADNNNTTSTNQFEVGGQSNIYGEIIISPGVTLSQYTRINLRIGIATSLSGFRPLAQLEVNVSGTWVGIWAFYGTLANTNAADNILNIEAITTSAWIALRLRFWDVGTYGCRAIIYDLKIFSVS
jgi:hypothetical protein